MKKCTKCLEHKDESCFGGSHPHCKQCKNASEKLRRIKNIERIRAYDRARYWHKRRDERLAYCKLYQETGGASAKRKNSGYSRVQAPKELERKNISKDEFVKITLAAKERKSGIKSLISRKLKGRIRGYLFFRKKNKWRDLLGADVNSVRLYLESQFSKEMTWENHGNVWHIDHYVPISSFDLNSQDDIKIAFNWRNLRPLMAVENLKKHAKIPPDAPEFIANIKRLINA